MLESLAQFRILFGGRPVLLMIAAVAVLALASRVVPRLRHVHLAASIVAIVAGTGLFAYPGIAIWYASDSHFFDNAEPTIVSVAWIYLKGAPLYPAVDSPERYAHIYGPMAFIAHAWALAALGPSIGVSKWLGVCAGLASLVLIFAALRRACPVPRALVLTGVAAIMLLTFRHHAFWTRPDSLQLFCAALAVFSATGRGTLGSIIVAGLASGVLWNLRITGALYSLPVFVLIAKRFGTRALVITMTIGLVVAVAPFLASNVSFVNYTTWLRLSAQTGLVVPLLRQNVEWAVYLCVPIALVQMLTARNPISDRHVASALLAGMFLVAVAASKPGAGPYHLIPFLPAIIFVAGNRLGHLQLSPSRSLSAEATVAWGAVLVVLAASQSAQLVTTMTPRRAMDDAEDVRAFLASHDGNVEMGYGRTEAKSLIRPLLTFRSNSYLIDQPAVREYQLQGLELPSSTIEAVRRCQAASWLIPKGEAPFSGVNDYPSVGMAPLYSQQLREAFAASYRLTETTKYYDVWTCTAGVGQ